MALIKCPECQSSISDKAAKCPHCGLPSEYFVSNCEPTTKKDADIDYRRIVNIIISFDKDYSELFSNNHYVTHREREYLHSTYDEYHSRLTNKLIYQYVYNNSSKLRVDIDGLNRFLRRSNNR